MFFRQPCVHLYYRGSSSPVLSITSVTEDFLNPTLSSVWENENVGANCMKRTKYVNYRYVKAEFCGNK